MNSEPGEKLVERPKEKRESKTIPTITEALVRTVVENLGGMNKSLDRVEKRNVSIEEGAANIPGEQGDKIKVRSRGLLDRAKNTTKRYKEALAMYARLIVIGSIGGAIPTMQEPVYHEATYQEQVARARWEMETKGITTEQRGTYVPVVNDLINKSVLPFGYGGEQSTSGSIIPLQAIKEAIPNIIFGRISDVPTAEDAWRLYLGIPQKNKTFDISDYQPSKSTEQKYYYKINDFWEKLVEENHGDGRAMVRKALYWMEEGGLPEPRGINVMLNFKMHKGEDERGSYISYYDIWDLDKIPIEGNGFFGKPYELYDRLYYNPKTLEPIRLVELPTSSQGQRKENTAVVGGKR